MIKCSAFQLYVIFVTRPQLFFISVDAPIMVICTFYNGYIFLHGLHPGFLCYYIIVSFNFFYVSYFYPSLEIFVWFYFCLLSSQMDRILKCGILLMWYVPNMALATLQCSSLVLAQIFVVCMISILVCFLSYSISVSILCQRWVPWSWYPYFSFLLILCSLDILVNW